MKRVESIKDVIDLFPYGVSELRRGYRKYLATALVISVCFHLIAVASYFIVRSIASGKEPPERIVHIKRYADLGPPPSISAEGGPPGVAVSVAISHPKIGVPVPVPDAKVSKEITIPTQEELGNIGQPVIGGRGTGGGGGGGLGGFGDSLVVDGGTGAEEGIVDENTPGLVPPVVIVQVKPVYPTGARASNLTGLVLIKALVGKDGKVKKAIPFRGPAIFYDAAVEAAMKCVFKPAIQKDAPVAVWVMIPFTFSLED